MSATYVAGRRKWTAFDAKEQRLSGGDLVTYDTEYVDRGDYIVQVMGPVQGWKPPGGVYGSTPKPSHEFVIPRLVFPLLYEEVPE